MDESGPSILSLGAGPSPAGDTSADRRASAVIKDAPPAAETDYSGKQRRGHSGVPDAAWWAASACILTTAAIARLYDLDLNPLHQDEGVNAFFSMRLYKEGFYQYDPTNYHGPTLYYFTLAALRLLGLTTFAIRLVPALSGVATVWLALCLRRHVGAFGALAGSAFIAASPGAVYMSRYFIHESLFVFFTFAVVVSAARYLESRRTIYLMLASAATALAFATKETAIISAGVLILGFFLTPLLFDIRRVLFHQEELGARGQVGDLAPHGRKTLVQNLRRRRAEITRETVKWLIAVGLFFFVLELFYSSFFSNDKWLDDVLESFRNWARTGRSVHQHSWYTYIAWLAREEFFVLIPGIVGAGLILWRATDRFVVFTLVWLCGLLCAYSVIPYKTPWLTLNFIIPLAIIGGFALDTIRKRAKNNKQRALVAGILCVIISASLYRMIRLNFFEYDDSNHPHVYAHTHRDFLSLTNEVAKIASDSGAGYDTTILIASSEYWPLPWYLRDYNRVIYLDQVRRAKEKIVIGSQDQEDNLRAALGGRYERVGSYVLRPGFNLMLYALRDGDELRPGETGTK